jgi:hypothetical protein
MAFEVFSKTSMSRPLSSSSDFETIDSLQSSSDQPSPIFTRVLIPKDHKYLFSYPSESSKQATLQISSTISKVLSTLEDILPVVSLRDESSLNSKPIQLTCIGFSTLRKRRSTLT